jgi:hypothetical protein
MPTGSAAHLDPAARLCTLGHLALRGGDVTRPKSLLLLAFLAHEGPNDRERVARLFFPTSRDPRDALCTAVRRAGGLVRAVDGRLSTSVTTDALAFERAALESGPREALALYAGPFVQALPVELEAELEEWVLVTRERLAGLARDLHLALAREALKSGCPTPAWRHVDAAAGITAAHALAPTAGDDVLRRIAGLGLPLPPSWWETLAPAVVASPAPRLPRLRAAVHAPPLVPGIRSSRLHRRRPERRAASAS